MANSILQTQKCDFFTGATNVFLEEHHIYFGANRKASEKYGFKVWLTPKNHRGTDGVHGMYGKVKNMYLKEQCQKKFEETHTRQEFIDIIGRSYL